MVCSHVGYCRWYEFNSVHAVDLFAFSWKTFVFAFLVGASLSEPGHFQGISGRADCNPIENLCHELKEYLRREVKPHTKQKLIDGILQFWESVDINKCRKYIKHLKKVVPKVIEVQGGPTAY